MQKGKGSKRALPVTQVQSVIPSNNSPASPSPDRLEGEIRGLLTTGDTRALNPQQGLQKIEIVQPPDSTINRSPNLLQILSRDGRALLTIERIH